MSSKRKPVPAPPKPKKVVKPDSEKYAFDEGKYLEFEYPQVNIRDDNLLLFVNNLIENVKKKFVEIWTSDIAGEEFKKIKTAIGGGDAEKVFAQLVNSTGNLTANQASRLMALSVVTAVSINTKTFVFSLIPSNKISIFDGPKTSKIPINIAYDFNENEQLILLPITPEAYNAVFGSMNDSYVQLNSLSPESLMLQAQEEKAAQEAEFQAKVKSLPDIRNTSENGIFAMDVALKTKRRDYETVPEGFSGFYDEYSQIYIVPTKNMSNLKLSVRQVEALNRNGFNQINYGLVDESEEVFDIPAGVGIRGIDPILKIRPGLVASNPLITFVDLMANPSSYTDDPTEVGALLINLHEEVTASAATAAPSEAKTETAGTVDASLHTSQFDNKTISVKTPPNAGVVATVNPTIIPLQTIDGKDIQIGQTVNLGNGTYGVLVSYKDRQLTPAEEFDANRRKAIEDQKTIQERIQNTKIYELTLNDIRRYNDSISGADMNILRPSVVYTPHPDQPENNDFAPANYFNQFSDNERNPLIKQAKKSMWNGRYLDVEPARERRYVSPIENLTIPEVRELKRELEQSATKYDPYFDEKMYDKFKFVDMRSLKNNIYPATDILQDYKRAELAYRMAWGEPKTWSNRQVRTPEDYGFLRTSQTSTMDSRFDNPLERQKMDY